MRLTVHTFLTHDGVMQGPGGAEEDTSGGFTRGGWLIPYADPDMGTIVDSWFARAEAILFGRTTFELMRSFWPQVTDPDDAAATALNGLPKYVVSSTLARPEWQNTTLIDGGRMAEELTKLKQQPGKNISVVGSATLVRSLLRDDVLDELRLLVHPIVVGRGKRLFDQEGDQKALKLVESTTFSTGVLYLTYQPAGT